MIGQHYIVSMRAVTTRYGVSHVLKTADGAEFFANASLNKRIAEQDLAAPFHVEIGEPTTFRPRGSTKDVSYHPVDLWQ